MPMNGTPILLCKNFAYVTGAAGSIAFDWRGFDSSYQNATLRIEWGGVSAHAPFTVG